MINQLVYKYILFPLLILIYQVDHLHVFSHGFRIWFLLEDTVTGHNGFLNCHWQLICQKCQCVINETTYFLLLSPSITANTCSQFPNISRAINLSLTDIVWRNILLQTKNIVLRCLQYLIKDSSKLQLLLNAQIRMIKTVMILMKLRLITNYLISSKKTLSFELQLKY